ncbi:MAG: hypothetical protein PHS06_03385 [Candidatus Shapirobacteria bacterium]|nr:hypothetical protein [Candidatus Shapirobacteria bacterium]
MFLKKIIIFMVNFFSISVLASKQVLAVTTDSGIINYTNDTLKIITAIALTAAVFFLIKSGYQYIMSNGKPDSLISAKRTIRNTIIGLVIVLGAGVIISLFNNALSGITSDGTTQAINIVPINAVAPSDGLTQVLIDAVSAFMQNIVESATKPITDGILGYLTTTPELLSNQTIVNFWLVSLGIVDSLFILVTAFLGLHLMSAETFGFEEIELKQILPRLGLFFLGANVSLFLANYVIITCNALVSAVLNSTGGLNHAWIVNIINPSVFINNNTPLITLIFLIIFLIVAIVLLFMFITRLIVISLGAVLSPFIFLLWTIPKFSDLAEVATKSYFTAVFMVFVQVVIVQLAASFLALPETSNNSLISISIAIGLFLTLLKVPGFMTNMMFYVTGNGKLKKLGSQIVNVMTAGNSSSVSRATAVAKTVNDPRRVVNL